MAAPQNNNTDLFDLYFRRADLNQDGRISGAEAVAFFQGANLPKQVLAQIWDRADQNRTGFLGRPEFYNALKLVTVAQSKRELTPDIVKAALFGPAAAKIPAPQINLAAIPSPPVAATPAPQMGSASPSVHQNAGFRVPQVPLNTGMGQQYFPPQGNQFMRPPQSMAGTIGSIPLPNIAGQGGLRVNSVGFSRPPSSNVPNDWPGVRPGGTPGTSSSQVPSRGITPSMPLDGFLTPSLPPRPQTMPGPTSVTVPKPLDQSVASSQPTAKDVKALNAPEINGFGSDPIFGGDVFTVSSQPKQKSLSVSSANSPPVSSAVVPVTTMAQSLPKTHSLDSLQSSFSLQPSGSQFQRAQSQVKQNQQIPTQSTSTFTSGVQGGAANTSTQSPWPRMTQSDVQKYTKVFVEVDTDRDGKITGEQARNLFLSWRLPREVLKQVWELSDQDNDSMLSQREFCTALYLMERYREGRPLPTMLPSSIMFDETLPSTTHQPTAAYANPSWGPSPALQQQHGMPGVHPRSASGGRPPIQVPAQPQTDGLQSTQQKSRVPVLEKHLVNQFSNEEQSSLNSKFQEATEADKKVGELEKDILDSKEKIEYYRSKMQELVLYKSRCDNRLNEIIERAIADKKEAESLAKKYEEKYKQVGDIASKLTIEEATFRDIQERKMELYNAIVKMEQGGSADGILQVRADRIQTDLEELVKALSERCKKYGLKVKPTALVELPFGWQPGIQEGAADWDEDWDKFEDEGFTFVKELTVDVQNVIAPPKEKTVTVRKEKSVDEDLPSSTVESDKLSNKNERAQESGSTHTHSEDESARSPPGSPAGRSTLESPSHDFRGNHFGKFDSDSLFHTKESQSDDHVVAESTRSDGNNFDEHTWGTFDDTGSVWGTKENDHEKDRDTNSFFDSNDFGLDPIRTDSPQADSFFENRSPFNFADSVPASPLFNSNSPLRFDEGTEHSFDNNSRFVSRFDSFNASESGFGGIYSQPDNSFARFDSMRSTSEQPDRLARFDSMRSTSDHPFQSFDDNDPFGSTGPFSTTSETPRRDSNKWSAF